MTKPRNSNTRKVNDLWSVKVIAEKLEITNDQVRNLVSTIPVASTDGKANLYNAKDVRAAVANRTKKNEAKSGSREFYEIEKLKQQIRKLSVEADTAEGRVIPKEHVHSGFFRFGSQVRNRLLEMVEKLPPLLAGQTPDQMQVRLKEYAEEILEGLRNHEYSEQIQATKDNRG